MERGSGVGVLVHVCVVGLALCMGDIMHVPKVLCRVCVEVCRYLSVGSVGRGDDIVCPLMGFSN